MRASSYVVPSDGRELEGLCDRFGAELERWSRDWGLSPTACAIVATLHVLRSAGCRCGAARHCSCHGLGVQWGAPRWARVLGRSERQVLRAFGELGSVHPKAAGTPPRRSRKLLPQRPTFAELIDELHHGKAPRRRPTPRRTSPRKGRRAVSPRSALVIRRPRSVACLWSEQRETTGERWTVGHASADVESVAYLTPLASRALARRLEPRPRRRRAPEGARIPLMPRRALERGAIRSSLVGFLFASLSAALRLIARRVAASLEHVTPLPDVTSGRTSRSSSEGAERAPPGPHSGRAVPATGPPRSAGAAWLADLERLHREGVGSAAAAWPEVWARADEQERRALTIAFDPFRRALAYRVAGRRAELAAWERRALMGGARRAWEGDSAT